MKVGILTFHRAINYGAVLQCYALYRILLGMGHDVEIVDYRPDYIERFRKLFPRYDYRQESTIVGKIKTLIKFGTHFFIKKEANRRFDKFLRDNFLFSSSIVSKSSLIENYDAIVFGSDQIWSTKICDGVDPVFWGQTVVGKVRLIAYAASMEAIDSLNAESLALISMYAKSFYSISVRESQLQVALQKMNVTANLVCDPVILANRTVFDKIAEDSALNDFVLVYSVVAVNNIRTLAKKIASQLGCKQVISVSAHRPVRSYRMKCISPSVNEFLGLVRSAKCVVTSSFHGTLLSIIFRKDFYSLRHYKQNRIEDFLSRIGLDSRLISVDDENLAKFHFEEIDYTSVEHLIEDERTSSLRYLNNAMTLNLSLES